RYDDARDATTLGSVTMTGRVHEAVLGHDAGSLVIDAAVGVEVRDAGTGLPRGTVGSGRDRRVGDVVLALRADAGVVLLGDRAAERAAVFTPSTGATT